MLRFLLRLLALRLALTSKPHFLRPELARVIADELAPFRPTGIKRSTTFTNLSAEHDVVWLRILNQSRIFVKRSSNWSFTRGSPDRYQKLLEGLGRVITSLPDVEFVAALQDTPPCGGGSSRPIMSWSKQRLRRCDNIIRLPCFSMLQHKYVDPDSMYSYEALAELGARPFLEREYGLVNDLDMKKRERQSALIWLGRLNSTNQLRYPLVRNPPGRRAAQNQYRGHLHMEGVAWSMRLKNLLLSGALAVFLAPASSSQGQFPASMFHEFYYDLIKPGKHYFHVDLTGVDERLRVGDVPGDPLARLTDVEAAKIAREGRNVALSYLSPAQVDRYLTHLLREYAHLLRFEPSKEPLEDFQLLPGCGPGDLWSKAGRSSGQPAPCVPCSFRCLYGEVGSHEAAAPRLQDRALARQSKPPIWVT